MSRLERCVGDFETRSEEDLKKGGAWKYAQGSTTEVTAFAYNLPRSNQPKLWMPRRIAMGTHDILLSEFDDWSEEYDLTFDDPTDLFEYIANGGIFEAHNAMFERAIWRSICVPRLRWPDIPNSQWRCSAAKAASFSLPRSLEKACLVQRLPVEKDMDGHKLMMKLCKPRRVTKNNSDKWAGTKEDYIRQGLYCVNDVIAQDRFSRSLPDLSATEQEVWEIDQEINEYGLPVDVAFVDKALANLEVLKAQYTAEIERLTNGEVQRHTQRARVKTWLASQGLDLPNTQAATMDAIIAEASLPADLLRVITVVRMAGRASTSKYNAIRSRLTSEGRVRDILIYAGAGRTSRWSGTGFQPQNITRGTIKDMEAAIANIMDSELEELQEEYDDLFQLFSSALRGAIIPVKGKKMAVADYNAIEGRGLFWVAEHEKGLPIFYDGKDPYLYMASSIFGIPYEVMADARAKVKSENKAKNENKPLPYGDERQAGKVAVLGCFSADTIVVTNHGNKRIIDVKLEDKVWDGIKWVSHKGLVPKGIQKTMRLSGVTLTPDHLIWTPKGFMRADQVQSQGLNFLRSATSLANLPSNAYPTGLEAGLKILNTDVPAVSLLTPILTTLKAVKLKGAIYVPKSSLSLPEKIRGRLRPLCLIEKKGLSGRTYTMQCGQELQTHLMPTIYRMEAEASLYAQSGRRLNLSYDGYPPTLQDTKQGLKLTGLITTKGTPQITVSLSPEQKTCIIPGVVGILSTKGEPIAPPSLTLKSPLNCHTPTPIALSAKGEAPSLLLGEQKHAVFDLAHCGDLNRFTILTEDGPLLVHNCGYGMGPDKLQMYAAGMGVELTLEMCQLIVDTYRSVNRPVCELWWACEQAAINAVRYPGQVFRVNSKIAYKKVNKFLFCQLPSGRMIPYPFPRLRKETVWYPSKGGKPPRSQTKDVLYYEETSSYTRKWELVSTYGAKLVENLVQALCRDIMAEAMRVVRKDGRFQILLTVHDELVTQTDLEGQSHKILEGLMMQMPKWADGFPLAVEGQTLNRYQK